MVPRGSLRDCRIFQRSTPMLDVILLGLGLGLFGLSIAYVYGCDRL